MSLLRVQKMAVSVVLLCKTKAKELEGEKEELYIYKGVLQSIYILKICVYVYNICTVCLLCFCKFLFLF